MRLLKLSTLIMLGLSLAATLAISIRAKDRNTDNNVRPDDVDPIADAATNIEVNAFEQYDESFGERSQNSHRDGDARHDKEELKKNQERLHVSANHKTIEMEKHNRGTFP